MTFSKGPKYGKSAKQRCRDRAADALTLHTQRKRRRTLRAVEERSSSRGRPPGVGAGAQAVQATPLSLYMLSTREIFLLKNSKESKTLLGFRFKGFTIYPTFELYDAKQIGASTAAPC